MYRPARSPCLTTTTWNKLFKFYFSVSRTNGSDFDETEARTKFRRLGNGNVSLTKLEGSYEGVAVISLSNPERKNALTGYMMVKLAEAVDDLQRWHNGKALVLHGRERTFCSGADLSVVKGIQTPEEGNLMCAFMQRTLNRLQMLPLISVAGIEGRAIGGGAELSLACDFRLMSKDAQIRFVQVKMGLSPGWGGGTRLVNLVGRQRALHLLGKGEKVDLPHGMDLGLIDGELFYNKDVVTSSCDWLSEFLDAETSVIRAIKSVISVADSSMQDSALEVERSIFTSLWGGEANRRALKLCKKHR